MARLALFWQFVRLTRPLFLLGGLILYMLGAVHAWRQGIQLSLTQYLTGQLLVTAIQLMTHYTNEYFDQDTDRINAEGRTWFSGGSGVLSSTALPPQLVLGVGYCMAGLAVLLLLVTAAQSVVLLGLGLLSLIASWFYSAPPLSLVKTGWGEATASLVVALLVPLYSYTQNTKGLVDLNLLLICLPLLLVHFAMLIAFQVPDITADTQVGKKTLSVRLGIRRAFRLHHFLLVLAGLSAGLVSYLGLPAARFAWLLLPLALWQIASSGAYEKDPHPPYIWLTLRALALFAICAFLWLVGTAVG